MDDELMVCGKCGKIMKRSEAVDESQEPPELRRDRPYCIECDIELTVDEVDDPLFQRGYRAGYAVARSDAWLEAYREWKETLRTGDILKLPDDLADDIRDLEGDKDI